MFLVKKFEKYTKNILFLIYRGYCTRRIRRLRKVMHLQQGDRRNFRKKNVTETNLTDER